MPRGTLLLALVLALAVSFFVRWRWKSEKGPLHNPRDVARVEHTPVCPWRNPAQDLAALFSPVTNYVLETRIVSGLIVSAEKQLGRRMHPNENPLRIHRVQHDGRTLGSILVTRVKGEHGGIEIVTGVETNGAVRGVLIQSQREPPAVAAAITNTAWLARFAGRTAKSSWGVGAELPDVPADARASAQAVADGVRDQLIVLTFAELPREARERGSISHH